MGLFCIFLPDLFPCKMSIAFEKLHKAKTNQSVLGISISIIASTIIAIPQRIPKIPPIKLIIFFHVDFSSKFQFIVQLVYPISLLVVFGTGLYGFCPVQLLHHHNPGQMVRKGHGPHG